VTRQLKYRSRVVSVGELVDTFVEQQVLVFFQAGAPEELAEFSILHDPLTPTATVVPGDELRLGAEPYGILAVGDVANDNFASLGHLVVKANGRMDPEMLGDVCVENKPLVMLAPGDEFSILGPDE
jgi:glucitol/sorbitol PTS system EIIA component